MSHLTIRIVLFGCAGALFGSFGLCLPVYSLTTSPGGQQGNLPGFVLGTAARISWARVEVSVRAVDSPTAFPDAPRRRATRAVSHSAE